MNTINSFNSLLKKYMDEPHEKIHLNVLNIILFSIVYYYGYLQNKNSFKIDESMFLNRGKQELNYLDFLYFSALIIFGYLAYLSWNTPYAIPAFLLYGTFYSFTNA